MIINNLNLTNNTINQSRNDAKKNSNIIEIKVNDNNISKKFDNFENDNKINFSKATLIRNLEKTSEINSMSDKEKYAEAVTAYGKIQRDILLSIKDLQNSQKNYESCLEEKAYYESLLENNCIVTEGKFHYKDINENHQLREEDVRHSLDMVNNIIDLTNNPRDQARQDLIYRSIYSEYSTVFSVATGLNLGELDAEKICTRVVGNSTKETFKEETDKVIENLKKSSRDWSGIKNENLVLKIH